MKNLVFDVNVILDLWLSRVSVELQQDISRLLADTQVDTCQCWVSSSSLSGLEFMTRAELEKTGMPAVDAHHTTRALLRELMQNVRFLSNFGFHQIDVLLGDTDLEDAQIVLAASELRGATAIVTNKKRFETGGKIDQVSPAEARLWLQTTGDSNPIDFIDLKAQQDAIRPELERNIHRVLNHGQYILGPEVKKLEEKLALYTRAKHCITVASGTEALLIALMAIGVAPGDEVITTSFSFIATVEVIVLLGAKPVFVDIEPDTCNINASRIEAKITTKTKAIMPVSLYGQPADMDEINAVATKYQLMVIEDAAQSFGATYKGKKSCNLSTIGCTSFFPSKPLGCYGDGGAIFTNDDALAQAMCEIRVHGQSKRYVHTRVGVGGRMDTLQCAVVLAKLTRFDWEVERRLKIGGCYNKLLAGKVSTVTQRADRTSVFAQYTVFVEDRDKVQAAFKEANIPTAVHYPIPMHLQPAYAGLCCSDCSPESMQAAKTVMSLPMGPNLGIEDQQKIVSALRLS